MGGEGEEDYKILFSALFHIHAGLIRGGKHRQHICCHCGMPNTGLL